MNTYTAYKLLSTDQLFTIKTQLGTALECQVIPDSMKFVLKRKLQLIINELATRESPTKQNFIVQDC